MFVPVCQTKRARLWRALGLSLVGKPELLYHLAKHLDGAIGRSEFLEQFAVVL